MKTLFSIATVLAVLLSPFPGVAQNCESTSQPASESSRTVSTSNISIRIPENYRTVTYSPNHIRVFTPEEYCYSQIPGQDNYSFIELTYVPIPPQYLPRGTSGVTEYGEYRDGTILYKTEISGSPTTYVATESPGGGSMVAAMRYRDNWVEDNDTARIQNEIRFQWLINWRER